jgi:hypothetical protein
VRERGKSIRFRDLVSGEARRRHAACRWTTRAALPRLPRRSRRAPWERARLPRRNARDGRRDPRLKSLGGAWTQWLARTRGPRLTPALRPGSERDWLECRAHTSVRARVASEARL